MYCLNPPLTAVPENEWLCPFCIKKGVSREQVLDRIRERETFITLSHTTPAEQEAFSALTGLFVGAHYLPPPAPPLLEADNSALSKRGRSKKSQLNEEPEEQDDAEPSKQKKSKSKSAAGSNKKQRNSKEREVGGGGMAAMAAMAAPSMMNEWSLPDQATMVANNLYFDQSWQVPPPPQWQVMPQWHQQAPQWQPPQHHPGTN